MPDLAAMMGSLKNKAGQMFGQQTPGPPASPDAPPDAPVGGEMAAPTDPYANTELILDRVKKFRDEYGKRELRDRFLRSAYRNILFYRGIQWIRWDGLGSRWRPANIPKHIPTPVTNIFADSVDAQGSVLARIEPKILWRPGSPDEPADRATADVASRAIEVIEQEVNIRLNRQSLATWVTFTGGAFIETGYDPDPQHGMRQISLDECPSCQATQPPGAPMCESCGDTQPMTPTTVAVPRGRMFIRVRSLFECYFDPSITDWAKHRRFMTEDAGPLDDAKERYPEIAEQIGANVSGNADEYYMSALAVQGPALDERGTGRHGQPGTSLLTNNRVTERRYWELPSADFPEGLLAIVVGERALAYAKPLPYGARQEDGTLRPFLPFAWFPQKLVPGTFWPKAAADDLALLQVDRNRWQSALTLCGMRMGMPIWLRPRGANVAGLTQGGGEAGAVLDYNALGPGSAKPERIPGQPLPMSFLENIAAIDSKAESLMKTYDVVKGARPEGVSAGIALQILQERGLSAYSSLFIMWEAGWAEWAAQAIEIFRQYVTEERLHKVQGRDGQWQVEKFIGADLQGSVDAIAEAGSTTPRSTLADRAEIEQLMAYGVIDPHDPETRGQILALYGKSAWLKSMTDDTKIAIMENEQFRALAEMPIWQHASPEDVTAIEQIPTYPEAVAIMQTWQQRVPQMAGQPLIEWPKVFPAMDGHSIHSREVGNLGKTESFRQFPPIIQAMVEKHKAFHDMLLIQQMAAVQGGGQVQGGFMQPAPGGAMPQQQAMNTSSSGKRMGGDFQELQGDVASGGGATGGGNV